MKLCWSSVHASRGAEALTRWRVRRLKLVPPCRSAAARASARAKRVPRALCPQLFGGSRGKASRFRQMLPRESFDLRRHWNAPASLGECSKHFHFFLAKKSVGISDPYLFRFCESEPPCGLMRPATGFGATGLRRFLGAMLFGGV